MTSWLHILTNIHLLMLVILAYITQTVRGIDCFECFSLDGNKRDCEDEFGPHNKTEHLISRNCRVGYLKFTAHYCVKIKGVKENGQHVVIRTCSVDNWGTQCGDLIIEQGTEKFELITGCLASCDHDGCNQASYLLCSHVTIVTSLLIFLSINVS